MQGFGKIGRDAARFLALAGCAVRGVSDQYGAIWNVDGIDIEALCDHVDLSGTVVGCIKSEPIPLTISLHLRSMFWFLPP